MSFFIFPSQPFSQIQLWSLGERCKLPQRDIGLNPGRNTFWRIYDSQKAPRGTMIVFSS